MAPRWNALAALLVCCGCANAEPPADEPESSGGPQPLLEGAAQRERLCGRGRSDAVIDVFCGGDPKIGSFEDLHRALGFTGESSGVEGFALTAHSTSLVSRSVSAINPRAIFIKARTGDTEMALLAFARGEQFSEAIVRDRVTNELRFYLTTFEQACNDEPGGCTPGDLLTPAAETGWKNLNVYAEDDLVNTPLDCLPCHQPDGPDTPRILRMQELEPPWNHWFFGIVQGGLAVIADYHAAKGDESFVGIAGADVDKSNPGLLSSTLFLEGSGTQPNAFVSSKIEQEVNQSAAALGGAQPADNSVPGESEAWDAIYERAKQGDAIPVPYHDVKVTDPDKLAAMTQAYVDYREGRISADELPDIRDVYPDDERLLAQMTFATEPGLDGKAALHQACAQCHNSRLDQTLSRARFNVDLSLLDRAEKNRAIARLLLPESDPGLMPPKRIRTLSEEARDVVIARLRK